MTKQRETKDVAGMGQEEKHVIAAERGLANMGGRAASKTKSTGNQKSKTGKSKKS